jgi:hypothetical protein
VLWLEREATAVTPVRQDGDGSAKGANGHAEDAERAGKRVGEHYVHELGLYGGGLLRKDKRKTRPHLPHLLPPRLLAPLPKPCAQVQFLPEAAPDSGTG